jgi:acetyl-CoA carboxylase carboxyl transferase subunit alpha
LIDGIVEEPPGGAHYEPSKMASTLKQHILKNLIELKAIPSEKRIADRIERYSKMSSAVNA